MYQRKVDISQYVFPQQRPNYPLPPYRGPSFANPAPQIPQSSYGLPPAPAPNEVGGGLMGYLRDGDGFDIDGSRADEVGSVGGLDPGGKGGFSTGRAAASDFSVGKHAGRAGSAVGALTGIAGLGTVAGLADYPCKWDIRTI